MSSVEPVVYVVDDDAAIRDSLHLLLTTARLKVRTFANAERFLDEHDPATPGCAVLDLRMPGLDGLQLQQELAARQAHRPVIFLTAYGDVPTVRRAMQQGAFDFLEKPVNRDELLDRVRQAIQQDEEARRHREEVSAIRRRLGSLSPREREVLDLLVVGAPNKLIADRLGVAQRTVEDHRAHIMHKMEAESLATLVRMLDLAENTPSER